MRAAILFPLLLALPLRGAEPAVTFNDAQLKAAVEAQLHVSNPTPADMLKLTYLVASNRGITDLTGLEGATNLGILNLSQNSIRNLSALAGLVNLTRLYLHENAFSDVSSLAKLKKVQFLTLAFNQIDNLAPLAGLTELTELDVSSNRVRDLKPLSGLPKLTSLDVSANEVSDLSALGSRTGLTKLSAGYNRVTDTTALTGLTKLTDLDLGLNEITDITPLAGLTALTRLRLGNNRIADIAPLIHLTHLALLSIEYDNPLNPAAYCLWLPQIQSNNPGLELYRDPGPVLAPGDATADCRTDLFDLAALAASWLTFVPESTRPDFSRDRVVDCGDLAILARNWLAPIVIREFRLDGSPGWITEGPWAFGVPQGQGGRGHGHPDPNAGSTGRNVYGVALSGDYAVVPGKACYLTTGPIDCRGFHGVTLTFARWLNADAPAVLRCTIQASNDGHTWQTVWQHEGNAPLTDSAWTPVHYDLGAIADGQPALRLRWGHEVLQGAQPYSGWNLDEVVLWATR